MSKKKLNLYEKRRKNFDRSGKCPICKRKFKDDDCPHSLTQVYQYFEDKILEIKVIDIVRGINESDKKQS